MQNHALADTFQSLNNYLQSQVIGQPNLVKQLLISLLADGHILVEGPPGLAGSKSTSRMY